MPDDTTVQMPDVVDGAGVPVVDDGTLGGQAAMIEGQPVAGPAGVTDTTGAPAMNPAVAAPAEPVGVAVDSTAAAAPSAGQPVSSTVVMPGLDVPAEEEKPAKAATVDAPAQVAQRISEAHNVLIALSADPSVDELATAIGLSLYLDKLGKRATAIYSGSTPNALEFLKPEETFENSVDVLQDFVIALNKEKADHLRYKLDGEFVKIYITPYRTKVSQEDLEFSYGDYNVDLVLALDVANGVDLDTALREHGRIMHDAVIINITTGNPGKLGEIEWSNKHASSVAEMVAGLLYKTNSKAEIEKGEATAFLTGIVAATNRFSNAKTTPDTMTMASRLMKSGANQQLISKNITPDVDNEMFNLSRSSENETTKTVSDGDPTKLDILHGNEEGVKEDDEKKVIDTTVTEKESTLLDDLKAAEEGLKAASDVTKADEEKQPTVIEGEGVNTKSLVEMASEVQNEIDNLTQAKAELEKADNETANTEAVDADATANEEGKKDDNADSKVDNELTNELANVAKEVANAPTETEVETKETANVVSPSAGSEGGSSVEVGSEKVLQPSSDFDETGGIGSMNKYGQMLEDALAQVGGGTTGETPIASGDVAPAPVAAEPVTSAGVPAEYMPADTGAVLPPPPTPPIDMNAPAMPTNANDSGQADNATFNLPGIDTAAPAPVHPVQSNDPGAFKIPGA